MKTVFIIHGAYGNPQENWFPWIKNELEKEGCKVIVPAFPTPENQTLEEWTKVFKPYIDLVDKDSIFVGHSLGPSFILSVLELLNIQVKACYFVAGFVGLLNDDLDKINHTFTNKNFNWPKIKSNCKKFFVVNSDNDPYISIKKAEELASHLNIKVTEIKSAGHFNAKAGFLKFEKLLNMIKKEL